MPESRHDPGDVLLPETPAGYGDPVRFRYSLIAILGLGSILVFASFAAFGRLLVAIHGVEGLAPILTVEETGDSVAFTVGGTQFLVAFVAGVVGVTVAHEGVHGLVFGRLGYDVSYGVAPALGAFYAAAFHQFQTRRDDALVGIAPLLVLDAILLPLLFVPVPVVAVGAFVGLLVNTAGAAGDLYLITRLAFMPDGTLLYDADARHMYLFHPENAA